MYRCIVIDDERLARERISYFIDQQTGWQVVAQSGEFNQAQQLIVQHQPELCFMDINIMGGSGIDLVHSLRHIMSCHWVFTTAYSEFALKAFDLNALDYLLKPFDNRRLANTLAKVEKNYLAHTKKCKNILAVKSIGAVEFVSVDDIIWIKGSANYVELHCKDKMLLHRETLSNLQTQLDPQKFMRVHRSAMVNLAKVNSLTSELGRFSLLHLNNGDEVKIGQRHRATVFEHLGLDSD